MDANKKTMMAIRFIQWKRVKGELEALKNCYDSNFDGLKINEMIQKVDSFVKEVESSNLIK